MTKLTSTQKLVLRHLKNGAVIHAGHGFFELEKSGEFIKYIGSQTFDWLIINNHIQESKPYTYSLVNNLQK